MVSLPFDQKRFIVTGLLVLFSLGFFGFFEESETVSPVIQSLIVSTVLFLVIPVLYCKMVLKEPLKNIGWQDGNAKAGTVSGILGVASAIAAIFALITFSSFEDHYGFPALVEENFWWFMLYELVLVSFIAFLYEVFFRGLIQLSWLKSLGVWGVVAQALLFTSLLFLSGDISWQQAPLLLFSPIAGLVAHFSRSVWYSFAASWVFLFLTDVLLLILR